jgi:hypothetical protein
LALLLKGEEIGAKADREARARCCYLGCDRDAPSPAPRSSLVQTNLQSTQFTLNVGARLGYLPKEVRGEGPGEGSELLLDEGNGLPLKAAAGFCCKGVDVGTEASLGQLPTGRKDGLIEKLQSTDPTVPTQLTDRPGLLKDGAKLQPLGQPGDVGEGAATEGRLGEAEGAGARASPETAVAREADTAPRDLRAGAEQIGEYTGKRGEGERGVRAGATGAALTLKTNTHYDSPSVGSVGSTGLRG